MEKCCACCLSSVYDNDDDTYQCWGEDSQEYMDEVDRGYVCGQYQGEWEDL